MAAKARRKIKRKAEKAKNVSIDVILYVIAFSMVVLFVLFQNSPLSLLLGILAFFFIAFALVFDFINSGSKEGYRNELIEVAIAIAVVIVIWVALMLFLHTSMPINVVPSCSMLPVLSRGDLVFAAGISIHSISAPIINVTRSDFDTMMENISNESLVCLAYKKVGSYFEVSQLYNASDSIGLFKLQGNRYVPASQQGLIKYYCGITNVSFSNGKTALIAYTKGISIYGHYITWNKNNTIIIYKTMPGDYFYSIGDKYIVHRAYAILNVSGSYYVLTKGDNNPGLDIEYGNLPVPLSYVESKVIFSVPYLGYLKLLLEGGFLQPAGCNMTIHN